MDYVTNKLFQTIGKQLGKNFIVGVEEGNRTPVGYVSEVSPFGNECDDSSTERVRQKTGAASVRDNGEKIIFEKRPERLKEFRSGTIQAGSFIFAKLHDRSIEFFNTRREIKILRIN